MTMCVWVHVLWWQGKVQEFMKLLQQDFASLAEHEHDKDKEGGGGVVSI